MKLNYGCPWFVRRPWFVRPWFVLIRLNKSIMQPMLTVRLDQEWVLAILWKYLDRFIGDGNGALKASFSTPSLGE